MNEFLLVLSFSAIPLSAAVLFACVAPACGAALALRNEILLGIALPAAGAAVIALAVALGVPSENTLLLAAIAGIALYATTLLLPLSSVKTRRSMRRREHVLGVLFAAGNGLTLLFMSLSPQAEAHFRHVLNGEILAVREPELIGTALCTVLLLVFGYLFRGTLYTFSLDEERLFIAQKGYHRTILLFRAATVLVVTGGITLFGPLLTTALLVIPSFFTERRSCGLDRYLIMSIITGMLGTLGGFLLAIAVDLPPGPVILSVLITLGILIRFYPSGKTPS